MISRAKHIKSTLILLAICVLSFSFTSETTPTEIEPIQISNYNYTKLLWPLPSKISLNETGVPEKYDPCQITYKVEANPQDYVQQMLKVYLLDVFKCKTLKNGSTIMNIVVKNPNQMVAEEKSHEKYSLTLRVYRNWELVADCYVGFLRGLETFSQLFEKKDDHYVVNYMPLSIDDIPNYVWRGVMIDTSRHFMPIDAIKHQIDALMYNKMSILHWHIIDEDSFPMMVDSRPELSNYGKFSGTYSKTEIKSIINYAKVRGVRVIVEIDTPAHTESWGRSEKYKDIIVKCNNKYNGQFDPTLDLTYDVLTDVMKFVNETFTDSYIHFGGDEISESCYDKKPEIRTWMNANNIKTYFELSEKYRSKQKQIFKKEISTHKKFIYWANEEIDMHVDDDDIIHWWGVSSNVNKLAGRKNEVILSNYDLTYLDLGFGGGAGTGYGHFLSWRDMYNFNPVVNNVNVIGGEACMWAEISNGQVQDQKVWPRSSVIGERLWNTNIDFSKSLLNIVERLTSHTKRLRERGIKASPVTVGLCENDPTICFA